MANRFLAFDFGAESGRAVVGTLDGQKLSLEERHRFANPNGKILGRLHWNLLSQWEEIKAGLRKSAAGGPLAGIGVDTWGVDFGLLDGDGSVMGNPVMYRDSRTDKTMPKAFARVPSQRIYEVTGIQFMPFNTLFQLLAMAEQTPAELAAAKTLLFMPDLFAYLLSGVARAELSIASTSQMYDPRGRRWAADLLKEFSLPAHILPPIVSCGTVLGPMRDDVAGDCGISAAPVIATAAHDTAAAVAAVPASGDSWCYISSGTWSLMGVELDEPLINEKGLAYQYTNEVGVEGKIRFLKNIMGLWLVQECRRHWQREGTEHSYADLTAMAERAEPFIALINPDHGPFLSPGDMVGKIDRYCTKTSQRTPRTHGEYVRACLEGLALTYRRTLEGMENVLGRRIEVIHIVGGGTQNQLLCQMTADACARTVITGPVEATSIGNILTQAMAVGLIRNLAEARAVVRESFDVKTYTPGKTSDWQKAYGRYVDLVKAS